MPAKELPTLPPKLVQKIVKDIDIDKLSNSLADTLSHRLLESLEVEKLANTVFERYGEELQEAIVTAIISKI